MANDYDDFEDPFFWRFRRTKPKKVKGGIKAQTKKFGNRWWAVRWLEAIEKFGPARRVARGRSYARKGQVVELNFEPGHISAIVQGSREKPYEVQMFLMTMPKKVERTVLQTLQTQPIYAATLLTGEVHPEIETLFRKNGFSLFPTQEEGERATCSCPDTRIPCKHIAAVWYLISQELERNPFLLLQLRGVPKEKIMAQQQQWLSFPQSEPLPSDPAQFWRSPRLNPVSIPPASQSGSVKPPILQRLGAFPFWRGEEDFMQMMEAIYQAAKNRAKI